VGIAMCEESSTIAGLYERRQEFESKYAEVVGEKYIEERAQYYKAQIEQIDEKYRSVILNVFFHYEKGDIDAVRISCDAMRCDPYLFFVCKLLDYKISGDSEEFLKGIPTERDEMKDLFEVDSIIFKFPYYESQPHPDIFDKQAFVDLFLDTIYELAANGNSVAIERLLGIFRCAGGEYGEYIDEQLLRLFAEHPRVVLDNWSTIRKYQSIINFSTTLYSEKADALIQSYQALCEESGQGSQHCGEVIEFLKKRK
jgi:hypothetical protein